MAMHNQFVIEISEQSQWADYVELVEACNNLNGAALKLYIYFSAHAPGDVFDFYPKIFCDSYGVSMSAEKKAFQELVENKYLIQNSPNFFIFSTHKK